MQRLDGTQLGDIGSSISCFLRGIFMSLFIFTCIGFFTVSRMKKNIIIKNYKKNKIFF